MSLYLGPIHYWLYNKILLQNNIVNKILEDFNIEDIKHILDEKYGSISEEKLENIVDNTNIHGWLQEKVNIVENRLAYTVKYCLENKNDSIERIKNIFYSFGENVVIEGDKDDAINIYKCIEDNLLDGMPCDRAKKIISKSYDELSFEKNICVHKKYWDNLNVDINIYYDLVDNFINGMLSNTRFKLQKEDNIYYIKTR